MPLCVTVAAPGARAPLGPFCLRLSQLHSQACPPRCHHLGVLGGAAPPGSGSLAVLPLACWASGGRGQTGARAHPALFHSLVCKRFIEGWVTGPSGPR